MMTKICFKCKQEKPINGFHKNSKHKDELCCLCKACAIDRTKLWYRDNKERSLRRTKEWVINNRERRLEIQKTYREKHREKLNHNTRLRRANNREQEREYNRKRRKERFLTDPEYALKCTLRRRFSDALKRGKCVKNASILGLVGCSIPELKLYLESKFQDGMTWENRGTGFFLDNKGKPVLDENGMTIRIKHWQIDHIIPCAAFDLSNSEQQKKCFHYTNLQPLWSTENIIKGAKLVTS